MRAVLALLAAAMLAGCGSTGTITRDRTIEVKVPVAQPCAGARPVRVKPLSEDTPPAEWAALDVRQKAARVGRKALERQGYGEQLDAATAACPEIDAAAGKAVR